MSGIWSGLAWTSVGGETLEVEVNVMDGSGKLELTGNLGDVMKESVHAALSYIRANCTKLGIAPDFYKTKDIHVHFPEGAVPKDGPSAGVTVTTAIVSALTGATVRRDVAMTGEVTLRGRVLRIGGLKEKTMAALRHGIRTVIIPAENERDLEEIDRQRAEFHHRLHGGYGAGHRPEPSGGGPAHNAGNYPGRGSQAPPPRPAAVRGHR